LASYATEERLRQSANAVLIETLMAGNLGLPTRAAPVHEIQDHEIQDHINKDGEFISILPSVVL
jgi:hypothetical protein